MSVEFVDIDGWDAVMVRHRLWAKTYWHIWEHLEHRIDLARDHQNSWMDEAMSCHTEEVS